MFNAVTNLNQDYSTQSTRARFNERYNEFQTMSTTPHFGGAPNLAAQIHGMHFGGGNVLSGFGSNTLNPETIDTDCSFRMKQIRARGLGRMNENEKQPLFRGVPYTGRGSVDSTLEFKIMHGERYSEPRSTSDLAEMTYDKFAQLDRSFRTMHTNPIYGREELNVEFVNPNSLGGFLPPPIQTRDIKQSRRAQ